MEKTASVRITVQEIAARATAVQVASEHFDMLQIVGDYRHGLS